MANQIKNTELHNAAVNLRDATTRNEAATERLMVAGEALSAYAKRRLATPFLECVAAYMNASASLIELGVDFATAAATVSAAGLPSEEDVDSVDDVLNNEPDIEKTEKQEERTIN